MLTYLSRHLFISCQSRYTARLLDPTADRYFGDPQVRMPKILIIHGIANQYLGESELLSAWYPALCDGLRRAKCKSLPSEAECFCPFYGDFFRKPEHLGVTGPLNAAAVSAASEDEIRLLEAIWKDAAQNDPEVPAPGEFEQPLVWAPNPAICAMNALAKSKYLADYIPLRFFFDLKQVDSYLNDRDMHARILDSVVSHMNSETKIVIGHSLGSVIAYEAVCAKPEAIETLVTLGSPLGIRNVVFDKLDPKPGALGIGRWPGKVKYWRNIAASGDPVAAEKRLAARFGEQVEDRIIDCGWDAHSSTRYLNSREAGEAIARSL